MHLIQKKSLKVLPSDFIQNMCQALSKCLKQRIKVDILFFSKRIIEFEKFFLSWVQMNILKDWNTKIESAYSFMLKYSKITVCIFSVLLKTQKTFS